MIEDIYKYNQLERYLHMIVGNKILIKDPGFKGKYNLLHPRHKTNFATEYINRALFYLLQEQQEVLSEIAVFYDDDKKIFNIKLKAADNEYVFYISNYNKSDIDSVLFMKANYGDINDIETQIFKRELVSSEVLQSLFIINKHLNAYKDLYRKSFGLNEMNYNQQIMGIKARDVLVVLVDGIKPNATIENTRNLLMIKRTPRFKKEYLDMTETFLSVMEKMVLSDDFENKGIARPKKPKL